VIYLDNNATTRPADEVVEAMLPYLRERYGNPSSIHSFGSRVGRDLDRAREEVAALLGADPGEVVFTSGGTEAINAAIRGALAEVAGLVVTSAVEHPATRATLARLERAGACTVRTVGVDERGALDLGALESAIGDGKRVSLVTLLWANNETGVLFPIDEVAALCRERGVPLHVDAVQAAGKVEIDAGRTPVDLLSISGHKLHGPKGIGVLFVRRGRPFEPLVTGGHQERSRRGGTENVPGIVGLGVAARLAQRWLESDGPARLGGLRDRLEDRLLAAPLGAARNGARAPRVANTTSLRFPGLDGEALLLDLSRRGIAASSGSACTSGSLEPSHVLLAMGVRPVDALGSLRLSLSRETTPAEVDAAAAAIVEAVSALRRLEGAPAAFTPRVVTE
jgi:cysteine desulfurase